MVINLGYLDNRFAVSLVIDGDNSGELIMVDEDNEHVYSEPFFFKHEIPFGVDIEDLNRVQERAEEIVDKEDVFE
jgi:hypothetical protein